jgi:transcription antitermination factor NusG
MPYWCCVQTAPAREAAAEHFLRLAGYGEIYLPRLRVVARRQGRRIELRPALFPSYLFLLVTAGWWAARWCPNVTRIITNGGVEPAHVPNELIKSLRAREVDGAVELLKPPGLKPGARVRIVTGPLADHVAILVRMKPRERIEALLQLLGGEQRVTLAKKDIEVVR